MPAGRYFQFGDFRLDEEERLLYRGGEHVPLPPKAVDILLLLIEHSGHLVDKETVLQEVWLGTFVEEGRLASNISVLRKTLTEGRDGKSYIETVPKRGYRFVAPVQGVGASPALGAAKGIAPVPTKAAVSGFALPSRRKWIVSVSVIAMVAASIGAYAIWRRAASHNSGNSSRVMLAVLPVQNLTGAGEQEYVTDGLTEEVITQLGELNPKWLGVIARTSSMAYKGTSKTVDQIGRELGVDYVLESSLRARSDGFRMTAQLVRTRDQTHLWAHDYDYSAGDMVRVEDEVAKAIANEIQMKLADDRLRTTASRKTKPEAYQDYLRGRYSWNQRTQPGFLQARAYFEQAIEKDPASPLGYAGLADAYIGLSYYGVLPPKEALPRAKAAAKMAIERDDTLAEPHASLATILCEFDWNVPAAESEFKRAIELNPSYATAHQWYGECMQYVGRNAEAKAELAFAKQLDPLSRIIARNVGALLLQERHYDEYIEFCRTLMKMDPDFWANYFTLGWAYELKGDLPQAIPQYETANRLSESSLTLAHLAHAYALGGRRTEAEKLLHRLLSDAKKQSVSPLYIAYVYVGLGDNTSAMEWLEKAYDDRDERIIQLKTDLRWDNLRSDPRFQDLERRVGLIP